MVTAGLHATAMGPKSNCSSDKQWYSLVKLDPYGLGHGSCDGELAELEELILSEPDHRVLDDATGFTGLSDGDANSQFSDDAGDDVRDEYRSVHAYKTQPQAYQKPGGPCDHCGAVDSPQWRRGPASKPMLCNACGTRYRRTNNLGPSTPMGRVAQAVAPKKRTPPGSPTSSLNPAKKHRCAPTEITGIENLRPNAVRA